MPRVRIDQTAIHKELAKQVVAMAQPTAHLKMLIKVHAMRRYFKNLSEPVV